MPRLICAALILPMLLPAMPAVAQETGVIDRRDDTFLVDPEGRAVVNADGEQIGEIEKILIDADGAPAAFVIELGGTGLLDDHEVAVPLEALHHDENQYIARMTQEQLENLPEWDD